VEIRVIFEQINILRYWRTREGIWTYNYSHENCLLHGISNSSIEAGDSYINIMMMVIITAVTTTTNNTNLQFINNGNIECRGGMVGTPASYSGGPRFQCRPENDHTE
jgi:hypothetical protein